MNRDKKLYGSFNVNGTHVDLGRADFAVMLQRILEQYLKAPNSNGRAKIQINLSESPIPQNAGLDSAEMAWEREKHQKTLPPEELLFTNPDVTHAEFGTIFLSDEYTAYRLLAHNPDKRITMTPSEIEEIKSAYFDKYPNLAAHDPIWVE